MPPWEKKQYTVSYNFLEFFARKKLAWNIKQSYIFTFATVFSVRQTTYLEKIFEVLINSYIETKVGTVKNFLNDSLAHKLKQNLNTFYQEKNLQIAGIGNSSFVQDKKVRGDLLRWLDRNSKDIAEIQFFALMDNFVQYLNETCYTTITDYEFHYTLYEAGSFYKRHLDQFKNDQSRQFSMIMYLNENWQETDGGELCIYHDEKEDKVTPTFGKCVFFKSSELHHEVLLTHKPRMSITGWLKVKKQF